MNIEQLDNVIQNIINDLEQDEAVRQMLNNEEYVQPLYADEDEGIALDVEVELDAVIEPFDYQEVVDDFDF